MNREKIILGYYAYRYEVKDIVNVCKIINAEFIDIYIYISDK